MKKGFVVLGCLGLAFTLTGCDFSSLIPTFSNSTYSQSTSQSDATSQSGGSTSNSGNSSGKTTTSEELKDFEYEIGTFGNLYGVKINKINLNTNLTELVIPNRLEDKLVVAAEEGVLSKYTKLESLTTPILGKEQYSNFYSLFGKASSSVPESLTKVIITCSNIHSSFRYVDSIKEIIFDGVQICDGLTYMSSLERIDLGSDLHTVSKDFLTSTPKLTSIKENCSSFALDEDGSLYDSQYKVLYRAIFDGKKTSWTANDELTEIRGPAFQNCETITTLTFNSKCNSLESSSLKNFTALENLTLATANYSMLTLFGGSTPKSLKTLKILGGTRVTASFFENEENISTLTLPNTITEVGTKAFKKCKSLSSIALPSSTTIGDNAFEECTCAVYILGSTKTTFGNYAFQGSSIDSVTIPEGTTIIPEGLFKNCTYLTAVTMPDSVTTINASAFEGCTALKSIKLPSALTSLGGKAFYGCTALTSVDFNDCAATVGYSCFADCSSLGELKNTTYLTLLGDSCFADIKDSITTANFPNAEIYPCVFSGWKKLTSLSIGKTKYMTWGIFSMKDFTGSVSATINSTTYYMPNTLKTLSFNTCLSIPAYSCYQMTSLTAVNFPESLTNIESYAFYGCTGIKSLYIPYAVASISERAFARLDNCESVDFHHDPSHNRKCTVKTYAFTSLKLKWFVFLPQWTSTTVSENAIFIGPDATYKPNIFIPANISTANWNSNWINSTTTGHNPYVGYSTVWNYNSSGVPTVL